MLEVKVKGPAIKLQGQWKFKGETAKIEQEEYIANKEYLEVISGEVKENKKPEKTGVSQEQNNLKEDEELNTLREKAKDLGIKGAHNMKKETLVAKIEEAEKQDSVNEDDTTPEENEDTNEGDTTGEQPQE